MKNIVPGQSFKDVFPEIALQWDYEKNGDKTPDMFTPYANQYAYWKCEKGHTWRAMISSRARGNGCKYCSNRALWRGDNDLATATPYLLKEWDYDLNTSFGPEDVTYTKNEKVHWVCGAGHKWEATIYSRAVMGTGCPICDKSGTSFAEQAIYYYIHKIFPDAINGYNEKGFELDIYIPSIKTAIEYDGFFTHGVRKKEERDDKKDIQCDDNGIKLIRIRDEGLPNTITAVCITRKSPQSFKTLEESISELLCVLNVPNEINQISIQDDELAIRSQYYNYVKNNSLASNRPDIAAEWHKTMNAPLTPEMVTIASNYKATWQCTKYKDHIWPASVAHRTRNNRGCPYCANQKIFPGFNDLESRFPVIAKEWSTKNPQKPSEVFPNSHELYLWKCKKGHEDYPMSPANKLKGKGCPRCSGRLPIIGETDLNSRFPEIAKEWYYPLNKGKTPEDYTAFSEKEVYWQCQYHHEPYPMSIRRRTKKSGGCPECERLKTLKYADPELASQWHPMLNGDLRPEDVKPNSHEKAYWLCPICGITWDAYIGNRSRSKYRYCPGCNKKMGEKALK